MTKAIRAMLEEMSLVGDTLLKWRRTGDLASYSYKDSKEVVSQFDRDAEKMIKKAIRRQLPGYKIWGEELGRDRGDLRKDPFVLVDAIDGSKNFLSGNPLFASQIVAFEGGLPLWSIVNLPALGELFYAIRVGGAYCNGKRVRPSSQDRLDLSLQCFGIGHTARNFLRLPLLIQDQLAEPRHYGCAGVHWSFLACGRTDIYIVAESQYYDAAPGLLLAREAGIRFCTLEGGEYEESESNLSLVAGNPALIEQYRQVVRVSR